ncbi:MAG: hypothetical protein PWP23_530 [Candidatus Sumerlaeota bacterium]|nr:hypothetical protein [Candidatus Sumerlaeota bacterium]
MALIGVAHQQDYRDPAAVRAAIVRALEPLGGMERFVPSGSRVLLKPNFVRAMDPATGGVTHPVFIAEAARLVRDAGASEVLIGDSPAFGSAANAAAKMGLQPMLDAVGARVVELGSVRKVRGGLENGCFKALSVSGDALDADVLINLPKAKAHCQMVLTGAVKNLFGCIPGRKKAVMHCMVKNSRYVFGRMLVDNAWATGASLHLADGIVAMEGMGPTRGTPREWGWVLAGTDPVALDRVLAEAWGYDFDEVPHLVAARHMKRGETELAAIELAGAELDALRLAGWERAHLLPITFNPVRLAIGYVKHLRQLRSVRA